MQEKCNACEVHVWYKSGAYILGADVLGAIVFAFASHLKDFHPFSK